MNFCFQVSHSQYWLKGSLAAVRLWLLHADRLIHGLHLATRREIKHTQYTGELTVICHGPYCALTHLYSIKFEIEAVDGLQAFARLDVLGISQHADVHRDLKVVLLLANESVISQGEVEALVSVNPVGWHRTEDRERDCDMWVTWTGGSCLLQEEWKESFPHLSPGGDSWPCNRGFHMFLGYKVVIEECGLNKWIWQQF